MPGNPCAGTFVVVVSNPPASAVVPVAGLPKLSFGGAGVVTIGVLAAAGLTLSPSPIPGVNHALKANGPDGTPIVYAGAAVAQGPLVGVLPPPATPAAAKTTLG